MLTALSFSRAATALLLAVASGVAPMALASDAELLPEPELADNGMHYQPWFLDSFLDLQEDLDEAAAEGKGLAIFIEQAGCPYCRELHEVNLRDAETVRYIEDHYVALQIDLRGAREVTDFDGEVLTERDLIRRWGVLYTPTVLFFDPEAVEDEGLGKDRAAAIMPGYFKPFHFRTMLEYVAAGHYQEMHFQDYVNARAQKLRAEGKEVTVW
ncbi:MAG: thioredoxin family protein [Pseudomonadota bacterium]